MRPQERRKHKRITAKIPVWIHVETPKKKSFEGEILDISLGGAFVHCTAPIKIGEEVLLEIRFEDAQMLEAKVVVTNPELAKGLPEAVPEKSVIRWARGSAKAGFGVEFKELKKDKKDYLKKLVSYFEALKKSGVAF